MPTEIKEMISGKKSLKSDLGKGIQNRIKNIPCKSASSSSSWVGLP